MPGADVPLTRVGDADLPAIVALVNRAYRGTGAAAGWNSEAGFIDGDRTTEADLRAELAAASDAVLLVHRDGQAGAIDACVWLEPAAPDVWYLGSLTVEPRGQNAGFGRRLLEAAEQWAAVQGARTIRMKVVNVRDTLIAWYERRGYRRTGETEAFPYGDNRFGTPKRSDLAFVVLEKTVGTDPRCVYEDQYFRVIAPERPLNCRVDGGHLILIKRAQVTDRSDLTVEEAIDFMRISMMVGRAMYDVLGIERMNYEDLGNWGLDEPGGAKLHLHFFGRARRQIHQIRGQHMALFPKDHPIYLGHLQPLDAVDLARLKARLEELAAEEKYRRMAELAGL
jgi:GNAT superfamily N-acetyltransferase/diadenosine tetraphosphate (Ap4A) HIT family hydrolase